MANMIRQNFKNKPMSGHSILQKGFRNTFVAPVKPVAKIDSEKIKTILKKK